MKVKDVERIFFFEVKNRVFVFEIKYCLTVTFTLFLSFLYYILEYLVGDDLIPQQICRIPLDKNTNYILL